jgi:hypothetical protein
VTFENQLKTGVKLFASSQIKVLVIPASIELIVVQSCSDARNLQSLSFGVLLTSVPPMGFWFLSVSVYTWLFSESTSLAHPS